MSIFKTAVGGIAPIFKKYVGGLSSAIKDAMAFWLGRPVEDGNYPNKVGFQDRAAAGGEVFPGRALAFDGADQYAYVADNGALDINQATTDFVISGWAKANTDGVFQTLFGKNVFGAMEGRYAFTIGADDIISFYSSPSGGAININTFVDGNSDTDWHLFTARIDISGSKIYVYVDGVLKNIGGTAFTGAYTSLANDYEFTLAVYNDAAGTGYQNFATTQIRDVRIYHKDITSAANLAALQKGEQLGDEVAWWFCEGTDLLEVFDSAGNNSTDGYILTAVNFDSTSFVEGNWQSLMNKYGYNIDVGDGTNKNVNDCVNVGYTSFSNATPNGFDAISDGSGLDMGATPDEVAILSGNKYLVSFNLVLNSGAAPLYDLTNGPGSVSSRTVEGDQLSVEGLNTFVFTGNLNTTVSLNFKSSVEVTNYSITNLIVQNGYDTAIPPNMRTAVDGVPIEDVLHNPIVFAGQAKYPAIARDRSCFLGDGVAYWVSDYIPGLLDQDFEFEIRVNVQENDAFYTLGGDYNLNGHTGHNFLLSGGLARWYKGDGASNTLIGTQDLSGLGWLTIKFTQVNNVRTINVIGIESVSDAGTINASSSGLALVIGVNRNTPSYVEITKDRIEYAKLTIGASIVSNYQFVEGQGNTVYDVSGNGNHLTGVNVANNNWGVIDTPTEDYLAEYGGNFVGQFNGVDDYIDVGDQLLPKSMCVRLNPNDLTNRQTVMAQRKGNRAALVILNGNIFFSVYDGSAYQNAYIPFTSGVHTYVGTWDGADRTTVKIYKDGVESVLTDPTVLGINATEKLIIGALNDSATEWYNGAIYDVATYNDELTQAQVTAYHNGNVPSGAIVQYDITGFYPTETDLSGNGNDGTWSGTGIHTSIIPALSDKSADALGQELVYPQGGANLIPETYLSMPEDVWELYEADQAERFEGGLMDAGKGTFTVEKGDDLNVSDCVNSGTAPYTSFANGTPTGFNVTSNGSGVHIAGTADEISVVSGQKYIVIFDLELNDGTAPSYNIAQAFDQSAVTVEGPQLASAGTNVFIFTVNSSTTGVVRFFNTSTTTDYEITNLSIADVLNDSDVESWAAYGANIIENEDNALKITGVDNVAGAVTALRSTFDLNTDLIVDDEYKLIARVKVDAGTSVNLRVNGPNADSDVITNTDWEWREILFTATHATSNTLICAQNLGTGEVLYIDTWELFHKTVQTGNNLIENGGARNAIGALTTTDWIDSNSDGVADEFTAFADCPGTIVTGNGFSGNAQRFVSDGTSALRFQLQLIPHIIGVDIEATFKYRTNRSDVRAQLSADSSGVLAANTGDAIKGSLTIPITATSDTYLRLSSLASPVTNGDWMEIDEFELRYIIDGRWYEPEILGGTPVIVGSNTIQANPVRYLVEYFNATQWKDLILLSANNDLTYTDHLKLAKFTKNGA